MSEHISHTATIKRLERSSEHKVLAGVCGGLGRYFDLNPVVFRLGLVVLTLVGGAGILVYLAAVLIMPAEGKATSIADDVLSERREHPARLVGLALAGVALFVLLSQAATWRTAGAGWVLVLVAGLAILWVSKERRGRRFLAIVLGTFGVLLAAVVAAVSIAFSVFDVSLHDGVGDRTYTPLSSSQLQGRYELGAGHLRIDLSRVPLTQDVHVRAHLGLGELRVIVPADARLSVMTHVKAGDRTLTDTDGTSARTVFLDLTVGAGHIDVDRAAAIR